MIVHKVFRLFGYEIEIRASPTKLQEDYHKITVMIEDDMNFSKAAQEVDKFIRAYGFCQEAQNMKASLRFRGFLARSK